MLHIGIDDTDSLGGGCTTWLITEIISELSELDLVDFPRLVRLNPNVPWKTRGNGALSLVFGKGIGSKEKIGEIGNKDIFMFSNYKELSFNKESFFEFFLTILETLASIDSLLKDNSL